jgi:hypothetical protein
VGAPTCIRDTLQHARELKRKEIELFLQPEQRETVVSQIFL